MRFNRIPCCLILVILTGCQPFHLVTDNRVQVDTANQPIKLTTENQVTVHSPPVNHDAHIVPIPVEGHNHGSETPASRIALVDVDGLLLNMNFTGPFSLGENPVALFREKLQAVAADPTVRAVVVRINSPGGSVTASDIMWRDLQEFRTATKLPVVTVLMDYGTGGAYYLATASDHIIAHPTTITGGIGVLMNLYNLRDLMAQYNIFPQEVKSGDKIDMGSSARPLSPEAKLLLETMAGEFHQRFIQLVRQARPKVNVADTSNVDGRIFTASQALERGLIDQIGYLDQAFAVAKEMAKCNIDQVALYHRANDIAHSRYSVTPNTPLTNVLPNLPGLDRRRLPTFLYMWQPEVTLETAGGR